MLGAFPRSADPSISAARTSTFCSGKGSPAVIFDSGAGEPGYTWSIIQLEVATFTRACWFDRAGYGWSNTGPFPRTSVVMSAELRELLQRASVPPPYIMVGHSLGGLNARVYNGMYPTDVAGMVLVDAAHEDEPRRAPKFMLGRTAPRYLWHPIWIAAQTARIVGLIRLMLPRVDLPSDPKARTREEIVRALQLQPKMVATLADASTPESYAQAERAGGFGDRPLIVLTRGKLTTSANPSEMDRQFAAYEQVWEHEIQPKLARLSTRGRQIIVETSGHDIPDEAPNEVIAAARSVASDVRAAAARSPNERGTRRTSCGRSLRSHFMRSPRVSWGVSRTNRIRDSNFVEHLRIDIDTSVLGGCFDPEFAPWSNGLMRDFRARRLAPVLSDVTAAEVTSAPEPVRDLHQGMLALAGAV